MVAPNDCSLCHTTANWNSTALPAGHMPNPGNQGCSVCHTAAPANYTTLAANAVLHTGITTGCITCHGAPNATPPVFYLNYTPKDAVLSPVHIPTSTTACESCHAVSFTAFSGTTMNAAKHTTMFATIGKTCDPCHDTGKAFYGVTNLTTRPNGHHTGQDCSSCHNPNGWGGGAAAKTAAVKTAGASTVSAVVAAPAATTASTALSAALRPLSHLGVTSNCVSCHNGTLAEGKPASHIASSSRCEDCHGTSAWLPARFEHQGVTAPCASCHNGVAASGKPVKHVQTEKDCGACHGVITWGVASFDHLGIHATCASCHNGITATGKQPQHPVTTLDCGSCHTTLNWTVTSAPPAPRRSVTPVPRGSNFNK
jgi:nitrate/TMAO reductase-like tetraheme cytochrome c subunit